jgi:hypothetical protein
LDDEEVMRNMSDKISVNWQEHLKEERMVYTRCGDQIKYNNQNEVEWVFSPRYCWYELPEEVSNQLTMNDLFWDFYSECYSRLHPMMEANVGYRLNFFLCSVIKGEFSWQFLRDEYGVYSFIPFKYIEGVRKRNYEIFQGMKVFTNDKSIWVSETRFLRRYKGRILDTKIRIYDRYVEKYKTIFNWLCVAYNGKEKFW